MTTSSKGICLNPEKNTLFLKSPSTIARNRVVTSVWYNYRGTVELERECPRTLMSSQRDGGHTVPILGQFFFPSHVSHFPWTIDSRGKISRKDFRGRFLKTNMDPSYCWRSTFPLNLYIKNKQTKHHQLNKKDSCNIEGEFVCVCFTPSTIIPILFFLITYPWFLRGDVERFRSLSLKDQSVVTESLL